jgi:8-hydroxy-5-deazaflavin:NADPH oxidoreductase
MRYGVLGTGMVGRAVASRLVALGHEVTMGSRTAGNEAAAAWAGTAPSAHAGTFADAAGFGEVVVNATAGTGSLDALAAATEGEDRLAGKVLVDIANPLDVSSGEPRLSVCNTDSLAEQIQRAHPSARVVKTLNTVNADVMVEPGLVAGEHAVFLSGDDAGAKELVAGLLRDFGWPDGAIVDLGDVTTARGTEMYLAFWLRVWGALGTGRFNVAIAREA